MQLRKNQRPLIDKGDPWKADKLQRKKVSQYLTPIIASVNQPFVISLSSPYGTGKSIFLECWKAELEEDGYKVVLFNAWDTDFSQDALLAFISALRKQLEKPNKENFATGIQVKFDKVIESAGGFLRQDLLPLAARVAIRKLLGNEDAEKLLKQFELRADDVENILGDLAKESLRSQQAAEESLENFKSYLGEAVSEITKSTDAEEKKKVIIFVDELDRCKPTYAIQILECIKHFFSVEGVLFVLAIDERQIQSIVKSIYGSGFDSEGYLRRFIDWNFRLPAPSYEAFTDFLVEKFDLNETPYSRSICDTFPAYAAGLSLTLREQEQCFSEINLILRSYHGKNYLCAEQLAAFSIIKVRYNDLLRTASTKRASYKELIDELGKALVQVRFPHGSWKQTEPYVISWFITADEAAQFQHLSTEANARYNKIPGGPEKNEAEKEWESLRAVTEAYNDGRRWIRSSSDKSIAEIVWNEFERVIKT